MRTLQVSFLAILVMVLIAGSAYAIQGVCSNCHTMHNSQNGSSVTGGDPLDHLLSAECIACHTGASGQKDGTTNAPIVLHTSDPGGQGAGATNAGGSFYWADDDGGAADAKGHNVAGISPEDVAIGNVPPGFDQAATTGVTFDSKTLEVTGGAGWGTEQLTCAGTFGCHGTRDGVDFAAIKGAHHSNPNTTATQASAPANVGGSFRFLAGIKGLEDSGWNYAETASSHNEYYGKDNNANYGDKGTISYLCAECHGVFHKDIGRPSSPWTRHPTDIVLPASGEYDDYNSDNGDDTAGDYSVEAPVARATVPATSAATVTPGTDIVMCLSCHRAHGSDQNDLLRWQYSGIIAGGGATNGCFVCHTDKN